MNPESPSPAQPTKKSIVPIVIAIVIILAIVAGVYHYKKSGTSSGMKESGTWKTYHQTAVGMDLSYPSDWILVDNLTPTSCCLFILNYTETATSTTNGVDNTKIQIGYYNKSVFDPFKISSTTETKIGDNTTYVGKGNGVPVYIIPRNDNEGAGIAIFTPLGNQQKAADIATRIIASIKFVTPQSATSTKTSVK